MVAVLDQDIDVATIVRRASEKLSVAERNRRFRAIDFLKLSPKQWRCINCTAMALYVKAGNQIGKTTLAAAMAVFQTIQLVPPGYAGFRQPKLNLVRPHSMVVWCLAPTWQMMRDGLQTRILGDVAAGLVGTGLMPAENILSIQNARSIAGAVDSAVVKRGDGTTAVIRFKTYEQGREAAQSEAVDLVLADEMPDDMGLWNELLARLSATSGRIWLTATPRKQQSPVSLWFKEPGHPERMTIGATIDDAEHLSDQQRAEMKARFANNPLEAATRLYGRDYEGGGLVLRCTKEAAGTDRRSDDFSEYICMIVGLDPSHGGLSDSAHPTGIVSCLYDRQTDEFFVQDAFKQKHLSPEQTAAIVLQSPWSGAPVAWGHGETQGTSDGKTYAEMFKALGLRMLPSHAVLPGGGYGLDASFDLLQQGISNGKVKINKYLVDLWDEIAGLERDENNKIIAARDDLLSALRYAYMMRKFARPMSDCSPRFFGSRGSQARQHFAKDTEFSFDW
jgi:phage terminase large subunit-like protein